MELEKLQSLSRTDWIGKNIAYYEVTDSTNIQAIHLAKEGAPHGTLVIANCQYLGKGRRGRTWESDKNSGIFMTLLLRPNIKPENISMMTLVGAISVAKAIREKYGLWAEIKWPNDIILNGKKICGILTEMSMEEKAVQYVVLGIGINVSNQKFSKELVSTATSLVMESGMEISRAELMEAVWKNFEHYYNLYEKKEDLTDIQKEYNEILINKEKQVRILDPKTPYTGIAKGITNRGELIIDTAEGRRFVSSGEVSVRGLYGYV